MLESVQSAYDILDQLHLSVQMLAVIGFVLLVTLVLTTRELAAWFFKVNSLKRELESLHESIGELKVQIARMQQTPPPVSTAGLPAAVAAIPAPTAAQAVPENEPTPSEKSEPRRRQFPISH